MVPLDFTGYDVTWVILNISGTARALRVEVIDLRNWIIRFGYMLEVLRVDVANILTGWLTPPPYGPLIAH